MAVIKTSPRRDLISLPTSADLSANKHHFVKYSSGLVVLCGAGERPIGVLSTKQVDNSAGVSQQRSTEVDVARVVPVELAATLAAGADVMSNAAGEAVAVTSGNWCAGYLLEGGDDGDVVLMVLDGYLAP